MTALGVMTAVAASAADAAARCHPWCIRKLLPLTVVLAAFLPIQAQILSKYESCIKIREQISKVFHTQADKKYKCEELKTYLTPVQRYKAAERQGLVKSASGPLILA